MWISGSAHGARRATLELIGSDLDETAQAVPGWNALYASSARSCGGGWGVGLGSARGGSRTCQTAPAPRVALLCLRAGSERQAASGERREARKRAHTQCRRAAAGVLVASVSAWAHTADASLHASPCRPLCPVLAPPPAASPPPPPPPSSPPLPPPLFRTHTPYPRRHGHFHPLVAPRDDHPP